MNKIENIANLINRFLQKNNLTKIKTDHQSMGQVYEAAIRSIWEVEDEDLRDSLSVDISAELKKYFGGKNLEEALAKIKLKLDQEKGQRKDLEEKDKLVQRMKDPNYVPTFEELMNS